MTGGLGGSRDLPYAGIAQSGDGKKEGAATPRLRERGDRLSVPESGDQNCSASSRYRLSLPALTEALSEWMRGRMRAK